MILSGARDRDWTGGLFLTKEALYLWATWAWTVILTVYYRLIKKTEKDKLFTHLLCIRNQKDKDSPTTLKLRRAYIRLAINLIQKILCQTCKKDGLPYEALCEVWSRRQDSNQWPADYKSAALPTELRRRLLFWSGKRGSNSQPTAWKAVALPIELFPHISIIL